MWVVMARAFLILLLLPTTLMPQGLCVCRLLPLPLSENTRSQQPIGVVEARTIHGKSCSCASCRAQNQAPEQDRPTPKAPGPNQPGDHLPGCPAAFGAVVFEAAASAPSVVCDLISVAPPVAPLFLSVSVSPRPSTPALPHPTPPLFISHCSLQI